jgi:hypothetical protein
MKFHREPTLRFFYWLQIAGVCATFAFMAVFNAFNDIKLLAGILIACGLPAAIARMFYIHEDDRAIDLWHYFLPSIFGLMLWYAYLLGKLDAFEVYQRLFLDDS